MAAYIYIASKDNLDKALPDSETLLLDDSAEYWFLYKYFESANLDNQHELIDLYGGGPIEGYQLYRLKEELNNARIDADARHDVWNVLVGWNGETKSVDSENWKQVQKKSVLLTIETMKQMIDYCMRNGSALVCSGD